jgi:hypothetical protein
MSLGHHTPKELPAVGQKRFQEPRQSRADDVLSGRGLAPPWHGTHSVPSP